MKTTRKTTFLIFSLCLWFNSTIYAQQTTVMIFKDHSISISDASTTQTQNEKNTIKSQLIAHIKTAGDKVVISYLHSNTASVSNRNVMTFQPPKAPKSDATAIEKARHENQVVLAQFRFINSVISALDTETEKSNSTQILEGITLLAQYAKANGRLHVLFFSDMVESSKRSNLYQLSSKTDAETKAQTDVKKLIDDFDLEPQNTDITIDCYLPIAMLDNAKHLQFIPYYWTVVFEQLFSSTNLKFHTL